jgi:hypothetical protein
MELCIYRKNEEVVLINGCLVEKLEGENHLGIHIASDRIRA